MLGWAEWNPDRFFHTFTGLFSEERRTIHENRDLYGKKGWWEENLGHHHTNFLLLLLLKKNEVFTKQEAVISSVWSLSLPSASLRSNAHLQCGSGNCGEQLVWISYVFLVRKYSFGVFYPVPSMFSVALSVFVWNCSGHLPKWFKGVPRY